MSYLELAGTHENAIEAFNIINENAIGLIFPDVQMAGLAGFECLGSLSCKPTV